MYLLHSVCESRNLEAVRELISANVNINSKEYSGKTALHVTCLGNNSVYSNYIEEDVKIVEDLLKNGANVNELDDNGKTPLDYALFRKRFTEIGGEPNKQTVVIKEIIKKLIEYSGRTSNELSDDRIQFGIHDNVEYESESDDNSYDELDLHATDVYTIHSNFAEEYSIYSTLTGFNHRKVSIRVS